MKVEDRHIFFRICRWINHPFTRIRVLEKGAVAVTVAASEEDDRCAPRGAVVGGEVESGGYIVIFISASFGGWGEMWSYA